MYILRKLKTVNRDNIDFSWNQCLESILAYAYTCTFNSCQIIGYSQSRLTFVIASILVVLYHVSSNNLGE